LFSGLGSLDEAQETLSIGVGALAGSTIMLLTVPWGLSVFAGRADLVNGKPSYTKKPKLTPKESIKEELSETGVAISDEVKQAGVVMAFTTLPYFLIQIPALFLHGPTEEVAEGEHWWSLGAFLVCLAGLFYYMRLQLQFSAQGQDKDKRIAITKKILMEGKLSLAGALQGTFEPAEIYGTGNSAGEYQSIMDSDESLPLPPPEVADYLKEILLDAFKAYDKDQSGRLEKGELRLFFKDFHENIGEKDIDSLLQKADNDGDGTISFDEFIGLAYNLIACHGELEKSKETQRVSEARMELVEGIWNEDNEEEEEIPEDFTDLSPADQQRAIKWRAFRMLLLGTVVVVYFSDPMVDVMQEIAIRANLSPFYVSFVLAPLASNASEVIASMYYASKKTRKTMSVSLSALEGAASMNNTFW
jgi:Ca2+/Na+ antiporter